MLAACCLVVMTTLPGSAVPSGAPSSPAPLVLEPTDVALVSVVIADARLDARVVDRAVGRAAARRRSVRIVLAQDVGTRADQQLRDCGPDPECLAAALAQTTVPLALVVVVNARVSPPVVSVRAIRAGDGGASGADDVGTAPLVALEPAIEHAVARVLDALGHRRWARIELRADPPSALVHVLAPVGAHQPAADPLWLPPGNARLSVEASGYLAREMTIDVSDGEDRTLDLTLEADSGWWQSPWFWGAVGVGVAAGVVGTVLALPGGERCACVGHPAAACTCP